MADKKVDDLNEVQIKLNKSELKKFGKGKNGEYVFLVDIENTKAILKKKVTKYKKLEITEENYLKVGADAERDLRECRYALQNIHAGNNSLLNEFKSGEKVRFDLLIEITREQEARLKADISAIKNKKKLEKEEKARLEEERIQSIKDKLDSFRTSLNKYLVEGRVKYHLVKYNEVLEELEEAIFHMEEFEFEGKRMEAEFIAKRGTLEQKIKQIKKEAEDKAQYEIDKKAAEENKRKVFKFREAKLIEEGLVNIAGSFRYSNSNIITEVELADMGEIEWYSKLEEIVKMKIDIEVDKQKGINEAMRLVRKDWDELMVIFKGLGGAVGDWKLKKGEAPSLERLKELKLAYDGIKQQQKDLKLKGVKNEILPFKGVVMDAVSVLDKKIKATNFKHSESRAILVNLSARFESVINEVIGEVINS